MKRPETRHGSQWRAQLGALGMDADAAGEPAAEAERARIRGERLPPLHLGPARARFSFSKLVPLLAVATAVALFVAWPKDDDWRGKGGANVRVYWERAGAVTAWKDGVVLREGDRVRAEIDAGADGAAYWLVTGAAGEPLVDAAFVRGSELPLKAGAAAAFAKSLQLVGPAAGETLHIVVCQRPLENASPEAVLAAVACTDKRFKLR